jgi:hypothetical protein
MDIYDKLKELEAEKTKIDQKIGLLKEILGEPVISIAKPAVRSSAVDTLKAIDKDTKILSKTKKGNVEITEEWIGGQGTGKPGDYYNE